MSPMLMCCQSAASAAAAAVTESPQSSAVPQSVDDGSETELLQSAELKRTELQLIRQIESIQEERSVLFPARSYTYVEVV